MMPSGTGIIGMSIFKTTVSTHTFLIRDYFSGDLNNLINLLLFDIYKIKL